MRKLIKVIIDKRQLIRKKEAKWTSNDP